MTKKESSASKTLPRKPTAQKNFGTPQISLDDASSLVGGIVEKGFSDNPQFGRTGPSSAPRPTVLPFPVARHRSHGPHWAAKVVSSNDSDDEDKEEEDFTGMNKAATFAYPVQRKEKKILDFSSLRDRMSSNGDYVSRKKKNDGNLLSRGSPEFGTKEKDVIMEEEVSVLPEEVKEDRQETFAMAMEDEQTNVKLGTAENIVETKERPYFLNGSTIDMELDSEVQHWPTTHFDSGSAHDNFVNERVATSLESQIDLENRARLEKMSADEIAEAQSEIMTKINPKLIDVLRKRGQDKLKKQKISVLDMATDGLLDTEPNKKSLSDVPSISAASGNLNKVVEASQEDSQVDKNNKVAPNLSSKNSSLWEVWSKRVEGVRDLRFNLDGDVVKTDFAEVSNTGNMRADSGYSADNVSERDFLRTEGDPGAAGYTIKEAVALTRSVVPGQRALALHLIASILDKASCSIYQHQVGSNMKFAKADGPIDWEAVWAFALGPEPELALSLRIRLDDNHNSVVLACAKAIQSVLSCDINESFFNISEKIPAYSQDLFTAPIFRSKPEIGGGFLRGGFWKYNTKPSNISPSYEQPIDRKSEPENTIQDDVVVAGQDIAAGLVRMGILPRISYLLETGPSAPLEECLISILIAIARHSPTCAAAIMNSDRLVQTVANRFAMNEQIEINHCKIKSVRLLNVLARVEKENCIKFIKNGIFHKMTWHLYRHPLSLDQWIKSGKDICKFSSALLVEQLRFWKVCVQFGYGISQFPDLFPSLAVWLSVPTFSTLTDNDVINEFAAITKEAYLLLDSLATRLPNFYSQMHNRVEVTAEDKEFWSWSQVGPIIDLALEWTKIKSIPQISRFQDWDESGEHSILQDLEVNSLLWIISSVMHMLSSVLKAAIPDDTANLANGRVPWLPEFVPKIGLEIIRNGVLSFSPVYVMSGNISSGDGSFLGYLCYLRLKSKEETSISSTCCLHGLLQVVSSVDKLINLAKHEFHRASARYQNTSSEDKILADGIVRSSVVELRALLSTFMKLITNDWQCMQSIELFGRGGPSPGVGVGWGAPGGGYWSKTTLLAQQDARLLMYLLENTQSSKDPLTDEELSFTMQRINSALETCMIAGLRDRAVIDNALCILLQVPVLKYLDFGIRQLLTHRQKLRSFTWKYEEDEYLLFANALAAHFRNRWLSVKKKLKPASKEKHVNYKTNKKGSQPLETIHEDKDAPVEVSQGPSSLMLKWAHQRMHLPIHWFLSAISTIQDGKNTDIPVDFLEVARGGLFFLLGIEAMSTLIPPNFHSPVSSIPIVWKFHAMSVTLLGGMGVLEEEKSRDVYETLQDIYGEVLENLNEGSLGFQLEIHESYSTFIETLVEQFAGISYGDVTFGRQVAIYLHRRVEAPVRLATWNALSNARVLDLLPPLNKCISKGDGYLEPVEDNERILEAYTKSWASGALDRAATRGSATFTLVLHHLSSFLFENVSDGTRTLRDKLSRSLLRDSSHKEQRQNMLMKLIQYEKWVPHAGPISSLPMCDLGMRFQLLKGACEGNSVLLSAVEKLESST